MGFSSGNKARGADADWERFDEPFRKVKAQLDRVFCRRAQDFLTLIWRRMRHRFQASVLDALLKIPYGETRSYQDIAEQIGNPKAVRAVGGANGSNPIPIIIPCHRVIGSNGTLTGFGGGLDSKRFLLDLETRHSGLFGN